MELRNKFFRFYHKFLLLIGKCKLISKTKWYKKTIYEEAQWVIGNRPWRKKFVPKYDEDFLKANPLCVCCQAKGRFTKATEVWYCTNGDKEARCKKHCEVKYL